MNIIYLHQYFKFPDEKGGTRSYDLATSFIRKGIDVTIITSTSDIQYKSGKKWTIVNKEGLNVHYIYMPYDNDLSHIKRTIVFLNFMLHSTLRLLKVKTDFVLATSTPLTIGIPALIKKKIHRTPYIFEVRDVWPEAVIAIGAFKSKIIHKILFSIEKIIYMNAEVIVPLSTDMQRSIVTRYPSQAKKTSTVIENISEIHRFQNIFNPIDITKIVQFTPRFSVLYAGTFGKVNGIDYVINLAEKTLQIDDKLIYLLIGSGSEKNKVKRLASSKNVLNKNVFILDPISKNELPQYYKASSMGSSFVADIKELWANSANKFFDTLAASRPVLINHEGWQAETIREFDVGYVLPSIITYEAAASFVAYTKNNDLILQQRNNALKLASSKYSLEIASQKYIEIFNSIHLR